MVPEWTKDKGGSQCAKRPTGKAAGLCVLPALSRNRVMSLQMRGIKNETCPNSPFSESQLILVWGEWESPQLWKRFTHAHNFTPAPHVSARKRMTFYGLFAAR